MSFAGLVTTYRFIVVSLVVNRTGKIRSKRHTFPKHAPDHPHFMYFRVVIGRLRHFIANLLLHVADPVFYFQLWVPMAIRVEFFVGIDLVVDPIGFDEGFGTEPFLDRIDFAYFQKDQIQLDNNRIRFLVVRRIRIQSRLQLRVYVVYERAYIFFDFNLIVFDIFGAAQIITRARAKQITIQKSWVAEVFRLGYYGRIGHRTAGAEPLAFGFSFDIAERLRVVSN